MAHLLIIPVGTLACTLQVSPDAKEGCELRTVSRARPPCIARPPVYKDKAQICPVVSFSVCEEEEEKSFCNRVAGMSARNPRKRLKSVSRVCTCVRKKSLSGELFGSLNSTTGLL